MSAALLWIYLPIFFGLVMVLFSGRKKFVAICGIILSAVLMLIALRIPVNSLILMGRTSLVFVGDTTLLGRKMEITRSEQTLVAFFWFAACLWFAGSLFVKVDGRFIPIAMIDTALIVAVMAVEPFIYGTFCVILADLITLPMLCRTHREAEKVVPRFLVYQILGMIALSIGGWLATSVDMNPLDLYLLKRAVVMLFCGIAFWLAAFPFFNWVSMLMDDNCPFVSGFIISLLQFSALFILLRFLNGHIWLRTCEPFLYALRIAGILMLLIGSIWTFFQKELQKMLSYILIAENGVFLLLLGTRTNAGVEVFLEYLFIHLVVILTWSVAAKYLSAETDLQLDDLRGLFHTHPAVSGALLLSHFMLSGMPMMSGFSMRLTLIAACFESSARLGWLCLAGCMVLLFSGFRLLLVFLGKNTADRKEPLRVRIVMLACCLLLLVIAVFPEAFDMFISGIRTQYAVIFGG